jgi:hypothetical protein
MGWAFDGIIDALAHATLAVLTTLWSLLSQSNFTTPDVTTLPQVTAITSKTMIVVDTCFVLAVITAGIVVMTHQTIQIRYGVGDLAPRLVVGFVAANFAVPLCRGLTQFANSLTQALTGDGVASWNSFTHLQVVVTDAMSNPTSGLLVVVLGLLICVLTGMLLIGWLVRLGLLILLVGLGPLALACHATPFTDPAARLWWRAMLGTLATVVLQALALQTTLSVFLNPAVNLAPLGVVHDPNGTFNLFIVACLLWIITKIPALMRRYVTHVGGQQNIAGMILKMVIVQRVTGLLRLPFAARGGGRGASRAARAGRGGVMAGQLSAANTVIGYWRPRMPRPTPANRATATSTTQASTQAAARIGGGGGAGGGSRPSPARAVVQPGINPATAMPRTRPEWQTGRSPRPSGGSQPTTVPPPAPPRRRPVPTRVNPATAMPRRHPNWRR